MAGGTSGIGSATVNRLLENGDTVFCACRNPDELPTDPDVRGVPFDATRPSSIEGLPDRLDGFIYFPGTINLKPFMRLTDEDFLEDYQINVLGAVNLLRQALPLLLRADQASAIFFSSVAAQSGLPFHSSIAAAKAAVEGMARSLAAELAPRVRVNAIAPSLTKTPLAAPLINTENKLENSNRRHPLNRIGDPAEIAHLVHFLLSEDSAFMTGQVLRPDGGLSTLRTS
mgnify:FL=1